MRPGSGRNAHAAGKGGKERTCSSARDSVDDPSFRALPPVVSTHRRNRRLTMWSQCVRRVAPARDVGPSLETPLNCAGARCEPRQHSLSPPMRSNICRNQRVARFFEKLELAGPGNASRRNCSSVRRGTGARKAGQDLSGAGRRVEGAGVVAHGASRKRAPREQLGELGIRTRPAATP